MAEESREDLIQSALRKARDADCRIVDLRFTDLPGSWQHFSIPIDKLDEELFDDGCGFDGSSIRGFQQIQESDMLIVPDPATAFVDPTFEVPTLVMICNIVDPMSGDSYSRDPRHIAQKAERHLAGGNIADISYWGPEAEFFIFNSVRFDQTANGAYYSVDSDEGIWNSGADDTHHPNLSHRPRHKEGYFPVPPVDKLQDVRSRITLALIEAGVDVEAHHHEVATGGQAEIDLHYETLTRQADQMMLYKYLAKNVARQLDYTVTFMPKPIFGDNGTGMHVHQSLWKGGTNIFFDEGGYALISEAARYYIGGLIAHAPALLAFCAPTTNSYRRLVPGFEAPVNLVYSQRNRSACVRIPMYSKSPSSKRIEFRPPDASANPYLAMAAMLMAGLDGINNKIEPPDPVDEDLYDLDAEEAAKIQSVPGSLYEVLDALEGDHEFLTRDGVFTQDVIDTWIEYKRVTEADEVNLRPHPYEFMLYYDV